MKRGIALTMIALGALMLAGLAVFLGAALDYRRSFTSADMAIGDLMQGFAFLAPFALVAAALVFFGLRRRKA